MTLHQKTVDYSKYPTEKLAYTFLESYIGVQFPNYRFSPHNFLISQKLRELEAGNVRRLMIFMPPRHGKTMQVSEFFPAWYLGRNPSHQVIAATYSYDRAGDIGRKVRNQLIDPVHQFVFPDTTDPLIGEREEIPGAIVSRIIRAFSICSS